MRTILFWEDWRGGASDVFAPRKSEEKRNES